MIRLVAVVLDFQFLLQQFTAVCFCSCPNTTCFACFGIAIISVSGLAIVATVSVAGDILRMVLAVAALPLTVLTFIAPLPVLLIALVLSRDPRVMIKCVQCFSYVLLMLLLDIVSYMGCLNK